MPPLVDISSTQSEAPAAVAVAMEQKSYQSKSGSSPENPVVESHSESSDSVGSGNASKKPVWKTASNGASESGLFMGAISWPTLSESTKASPKAPSSDTTSKGSADASVSRTLPQVTGANPVTSSSSLATASSTSPRVGNSNASPNSNPNLPNATLNHGRPNRQRSMRREGGGNSSSNGGFSHQTPHSVAGSVGDAAHNNTSVKTGSGSSESSGREQVHNNNIKEGGQRGGGEYSNQRNSYRRSNSGPHSRGDGSSHQNFGGGKRDQERGNHDWSHSRSFNGRDPSGPPQRGGSRGFMRPQTPAAPFVAPALGMRPPYANPMVISQELHQPLYYFPHPGMPYVPQMAPAYVFPPHDPQLLADILYQIDYYFSNENLCKDTYLRQKMDDNGWVSIHLIAGFKKVKQLTNDIQLILDAVRASTIVETQGDKIRRRGDWLKWLMPPAVQSSAASASHSPRIAGSDSSLPSQFQGLSLKEKASSTMSVSGTSPISSSGDQNVKQESLKDASGTLGC